MGATDPREGYLSLISLEKSHVNLSPPIVFLFGGSIEPPTQSVRGLLYNHILVKHPSLRDSLVIPEDFADWLHDSVYPDLLSFESDLAQTSTLVIIALESPGAIAELGSFSVNTELKNKVVVIISEHHHGQKSFITLGPLRQLDESNVYSYPYDPNTISSSIDEYLDDIVQNINSNIKGLQKTERFNTENNGHVALLIFELVLMYKALKLGEIKDFLKSLSIERTNTVIKRLLFLLSKLCLVRSQRMGNIDYYLPMKTEQRVEFTSNDASKLFDKSSAIMGAAQYYSLSEKEKMRRRVIKKPSDVGGQE